MSSQKRTHAGIEDCTRADRYSGRHLFISYPMDNPILFSGGDIQTQCALCGSSECFNPETDCAGKSWEECKKEEAKNKKIIAGIIANTKKFGHHWKFDDDQESHTCSRCGLREDTVISGYYTLMEGCDCEQTFSHPSGTKNFSVIFCPKAPNQAGIANLVRAARQIKAESKAWEKSAERCALIDYGTRCSYPAEKGSKFCIHHSGWNCTRCGKKDPTHLVPHPVNDCSNVALCDSCCERYPKELVSFLRGI